MAEKVFKSAGVFATETDLSQPTAASPSGIPAGVVGTALSGPAFVPITVGSFNDFKRVFGATDGKKFGPLAVYTFLEQASALTYLRVLGAGDGLQRSTSTGKVNRAGFTVGGDMVQGDGIVGSNPFAVSPSSHPYPTAGRTAFIGCFMSESAGSNVFSAAGLQSYSSTGNRAIPVVRGVLMVPSGVVPTLSGCHIGGEAGKSAQPSNTVPALEDGTDRQGGTTGSVNPATGEFVLLLNGHKSTDAYPNVITASFMLGDSYFKNKFNTEKSKLQEAGHYLYAHYDIVDGFAKITGSHVINPMVPQQGERTYADSTAIEDIGFILTGSAARNEGSAGVSPNYESFEDRFTTAKTPFFISQDFGGTKHNLFRVHSRGDGADPTAKYKISIENIAPANEVATDKFGSFDLLVRKWDDTDWSVQAAETHVGLSLDPSSDKFIGRVIGDQRVFFDFDQAVGSQKLVVEGNHPGSSALIRVEIPRALELGYIPEQALPIGFRGPAHLVTSGSGPLATYPLSSLIGGEAPLQSGVPTDILKQAIELPIRYRKDVRVGTAGATDATIHDVMADASVYWGVQYKLRSPDKLITNAFGEVELRSLNSAGVDADTSMKSRTLYFPNFDPQSFKFVVGNNPGVADVNGTVLDCDKFNNNIFSLERIRVKTGSSGDIADPEMWQSASYVRKGVIAADLGMRAFKVDDLRTTGNRTYAKFTTFMQGGFDGVDIFNVDKSRLNSTACKREMDDSTNQGGTSGATVATYRKAIDIMGVKADVDINLLTIPGIRSSGVTDYAITSVENRFDAMYIMDIEQRDEDNTVMTGSKDADGNLIIPSISNTVAGFASRGLDTSFAAAYYPDVYITDPTTGGNVTAPPSVAVLGVMSQNDKLGRPWFAPAGYTRGVVDKSIHGTSLGLERADLDDLYDSDINPIVSFAGASGPVVWGQKTLQANASALDRVNVRRLLIDIRRKVKNIANSLLFEPNRQETLDKFNALVKPVMQTVQQQQGVDRFKVIIDTTTTTQADVENNTIRGKIYLQPTRTAEFIALDFTVTNAGNFDSV